MSENQQVLDSIRKFPDQLEQVWHDSQRLILPPSYLQCRNIAFCGMGGSLFGGRVASSLFQDRIKLPVNLINDYDLPSYVDEETLLILSTYSGTTEEVLAIGELAAKAKAKCVGVTTGTKLIDQMRANNQPFLQINPINNPSGKPRLGVGYTAGVAVSILSKARFLDFGEEEMAQLVLFLRNNDPVAGSREISSRLVGKIPLFVSANFLEGASHIFCNTINEDAKNFAVSFTIPELNHHLMEGLAFPKTNKGSLIFVFFESDLYSGQVQKRFEITKDVVRQNNIEFITYKLKGATRAQQGFELIQLGGHTSYELALLNGVDPGPIPWVDYFKEQLSKNE